MYTKLIIDQLPAGEKVVESVIGGVMENCTQDTERLVPLARDLSNMPPVRKAILELWQFLVDTLVENTLGVPNSQRAASFTKKRLEAHEGQLQAFIGNEDIFCAALCVADTEQQATRNFCGVFNTIDDVSMTGNISCLCFVECVLLPDRCAYGRIRLKCVKIRAFWLELLLGLSCTFYHSRQSLWRLC